MRDIRTMRLPLGSVLAVMLVGVLLGLAPFGAALEIHHALAAADHDGHQHSDSDLCQWVQHHTGSSLSTAPPTVTAVIPAEKSFVAPPVTLISVEPSPSGPSRAPPLL